MNSIVRNHVQWAKFHLETSQPKRAVASLERALKLEVYAYGRTHRNFELRIKLAIALDNARKVA